MEERKKIVLVSHCFLNNATKLKYENKEEARKERKEKQDFIKKMLYEGVELIQLPCPEFIIYGSNRWGHAASQFDTPFYRNTAKKLLEPVILQLKEYQSHPERFEIIGVVGIDGSPSCGIHYTYDGDWGGEFSANQNLSGTLASIKRIDKPGIFMDVFMEEAKRAGLNIEFHSLKSIV